MSARCVVLLAALVVQGASAQILTVQGSPGAIDPPVEGGGDNALGILAASMAAGDWRPLKTLNFSGMTLPNEAGNSSSPIVEFTDRAVYDPIGQQIHIVGCARGVEDPAYQCGDSTGEDAGYSIYDIRTNTWSRGTHPINAAPHAYNHATVDPTTGDFYYWEAVELTGHQLRKRTGSTWSTIAKPGGVWSSFGALEWFVDTNELVFVDGGNGFAAKLCIRDMRRGKWDCRLTVPALASGFSNFSQYSPQHRLIYFGGGTGNASTLMMLHADHSVTRGEDAPTGLGLGTFGASGKQSVNPANGNLLAFDNDEPGKGNVYEYDPDADNWTVNGMHPLGEIGGQLLAVFASVPDYCVVFAVNRNPDDVWLYKPAECSP